MIVTVIYLVSLMVFMVVSTPLVKEYGWPEIRTNIGTTIIGGLSYTTWTVSDRTQPNILQSDVYVQVHNATGFVIPTIRLTTASGTHGFLYVPATNGNNITPGDVFALSTNYKVNCTLTLVTGGGTGMYCFLVVPATIPSQPLSLGPLGIVATVDIAAIAAISIAIIVLRRRRKEQ
jgi:hypothetical protein